MPLHGPLSDFRFPPVMAAQQKDKREWLPLKMVLRSVVQTHAVHTLEETGWSFRE